MEVMAHTSKNSEREFISMLINLYRNSPELWKIKHRDYFNKNIKNSAFVKIVEALKVLKPDYNVQLLKQKINVLRTNFNREYKALEMKKLMGVPMEEIPEPSLWYYNDLCFIKDQLEVTPSEMSTEQTERLIKTEPVDCFYTEESNPDFDTDDPSTTLHSKRSHSPTTDCPEEKKLKSKAASTNEIENEWDIYGRHVATQLKLLSPLKAITAQMEINNILTKCRFNDIYETMNQNDNL